MYPCIDVQYPFLRPWICIYNIVLPYVIHGSVAVKTRSAATLAFIGSYNGVFLCATGVFLCCTGLFCFCVGEYYTIF